MHPMDLRVKLNSKKRGTRDERSKKIFHATMALHTQYVKLITVRGKIKLIELIL
jgi:hypothetical protein